MTAEARTSKPNGKMPDFARLAWVSDEAAAHWKPVCDAIAAEWRELEWQAVRHGLRRVALAMLRLDDLTSLSLSCADAGLSVMPLGVSGAGGGQFRNRTAAPRHGDRFTVRTAIGRIEDLAAFSGAWQERDDEAIGRMLGYPDCCYRFFRRHWSELGLVDTTWSMASASQGASNGVDDISLEIVPETNILCRYVGVRPVPHLPCRFDCERSVALARDLGALAKELGQAATTDHAMEILSWPLEWSARNGIAIIKLPVAKIVAATDIERGRRTLRLLGRNRPEYAASGIGFPYAKDLGLPGKTVSGESRAVRF